MQNNDNKKSGMISVELTFGILFSVLALFIVFGPVNEVLNGIAKNGNIKNITTENNTKTSFTSYNRDYANSTVSVK